MIITAVCLDLSEPPLAFSHSPGCMFLTDVPDAPSAGTDPQLAPLCFLVSHNPLLYSLVSKATAGKIRQLERIIGDDPGKGPVLMRRTTTSEGSGRVLKVPVLVLWFCRPAGNRSSVCPG